MDNKEYQERCNHLANLASGYKDDESESGDESDDEIETLPDVCKVCGRRMENVNFPVDRDICSEGCAEKRSSNDRY